MAKSDGQNGQKSDGQNESDVQKSDCFSHRKLVSCRNSNILNNILNKTLIKYSINK